MKLLLLSLLFTFTSLFGNYEYDLAICGIFQNEAKYLPEWIEFHLDQGVEHFYLYNNRSEDNYREVLAPYIESNIVDLYEWDYVYNYEHEWTPIQCGAYLDCIKRISKTVKWCAFLDTDEFLFNPDFKDLRSVLNDYKHYNNIWAHWMFYGTSGVEKIPDGENITDHLVYRAKEGSSIGKSIVRPKYVANCVNPHFFYMKDGSIGVNENKVIRNAPYIWDQPYSGNVLRINHYWLRDRDFMFNVKIPRRLKWSDNIDAILQSEELMNQVYDPILRGAK